MEAGGHDASHLRAVLATLPLPTQSRQSLSHLREEEELSTADYLNIRVGDLFANGITDEVLAQLIEMDSSYNQKELEAMCKDAGLSSRGGKKELAAKLLASGRVKDRKVLFEKEMPEEAQMQENQVNLLEQNQWQAGPDEELKIPEVYLRRLKFEIVVFTTNKDFTFRCSGYEHVPSGGFRFANVIIDTSKLNPQGEVELKRVTFHPELELVNVPFMAMPAPEDLVPGEAD